MVMRRGEWALSDITSTVGVVAVLQHIKVLCSEQLMQWMMYLAYCTVIHFQFVSYELYSS